MTAANNGDASSNRNVDWYTDQLRLLNFFLLLFSSIFWIWAMINTATQNYFDLGTISFLTVLLSSAYMLWIIKGKGSDQMVLRSDNCCRRCSLGLPTLSHLLVAINYGLGASVTEHMWGQMYCAVFAGLWICFLLVHLILVAKIRRDGGGKAEAAYGDAFELEAVGTPGPLEGEMT